jgi:hypothetical protein
MFNLKYVNITVDQDHTIEVDVDPIVVSRRRGERIQWSCPNGVKFEIQFKPENSPFKIRHFVTASGGAIISSVPRKNSPRVQPYKYDVVVTLKNGERAVLDPHVIVEE